MVRALEQLLQDATAGDPITGLKWTHRSLRKLCKALRRLHLKASPPTVARLMGQQGFSLRTCRKQRAGIRHPDRDRQFRFLVRLVERKLIFLGVNGADEFVFLHFELGAPDIKARLEERDLILRGLDCSIVFGFDNVLLSLQKLGAALFQLVNLFARIKLDHHIALFDRSSGVEKFRNV